MYYDQAMNHCHKKGYKVSKIKDYLSTHGIQVEEQTILSMFTDSLNRKYLGRVGNECT